MLVLDNLKPGRRIKIGSAELVVMRVGRGRVTLGVEAERDVSVLRIKTTDDDGHRGGEEKERAA